MWNIAELGLECERYDIGHKFGGNDTPDFLAMNPNGTVPVLQDGDNEPLWESAAIARYLANAYGNETFWPKDRDQDAITQALTNFENNLRLAEIQLAKHDFITGDDFTLADIQLGYLLYRYYDMDIDRAELPALAAYYQRLTERSAYKEQVMISYDDLRVT